MGFYTGGKIKIKVKKKENGREGAQYLTSRLQLVEEVALLDGGGPRPGRAVARHLHVVAQPFRLEPLLVDGPLHPVDAAEPTANPVKLGNKKKSQNPVNTSTLVTGRGWRRRSRRRGRGRPAAAAASAASASAGGRARRASPRRCRRRACWPGNGRGRPWPAGAGPERQDPKRTRPTPSPAPATTNQHRPPHRE